jgi:hypothetical protein
MIMPFARHILPRQPMQVFIDQGYQVIERTLVTCAPRLEQLRDLVRRSFHAPGPIFQARLSHSRLRFNGFGALGRFGRL